MGRSSGKQYKTHNSKIILLKKGEVVGLLTHYLLSVTEECCWTRGAHEFPSIPGFPMWAEVKALRQKGEGRGTWELAIVPDPINMVGNLYAIVFPSPY